ncbi:MAG TPA: chromosome partitioning protein ParB, partial [Deinococcales bacterium]|nr:chromosome partitioning protein ParB [Deinococcales bacterium]
LRLLKLPEEALAALQAGEITPGHARAILALPARARGRALKLITAQGLTVRQAEALRETLGTERKAGRPEEARPHSQLELELSRHAGTKVRLVGGRRGRLELHYGSPEELERLIGLLGYQP